jgi:hypothetical protein
LVLHKIKNIQNFNTLYTSNCPFLIIHFMTNKTYRNCTKFNFMKINKYKNILKVISLNYNPYNSCNHFSKSWGCKILCVYTQSLNPFTMNAPKIKMLKSKSLAFFVWTQFWLCGFFGATFKLNLMLLLKIEKNKTHQ